MNEPTQIELHAAHGGAAVPGCPICDIVLGASVPPATCQHQRFAMVADVGRIADAASGDVVYFCATMVVYCADCAGQFGWRGFANRIGADPRIPLVDPSALELRAPLIPPSELALLGPLAAMRPENGPHGPGYRLHLEG